MNILYFDRNIHLKVERSIYGESCSSNKTTHKTVTITIFYIGSPMKNVNPCHVTGGSVPQ